MHQLTRLVATVSLTAMGLAGWSGHGNADTAPTLSLTAKQGAPVTISAARLFGIAGGGSVVGIDTPAHGTLAAGPGGSLVYRPTPGFTGTDHLRVTVSRAVTAFATNLPPLAVLGGVPVESSAYGSAMAPVPGSAHEFYGLTDRGPNVDGTTDGQKIEPLPDFTPAIGRFRLTAGSARLIRSIPLRGTDGKPMNGRVNSAASTGETILDRNGAPVAPSDHGLDPEGLVALRDGTFWVSDEYGPFLVHFDASGKEIERLAPGAGLPAELSLRTPNQGMEGLTVTPDGTTLVGAMQSGLNTPGLDGKAKKVPFTRIVTVNLLDHSVREYGYILDNPASTKKAISEITAVSGTEFLVDERDGNLEPAANKVIYRVSTAGATDIGPHAHVPGAHYDSAQGLLIGTTPIETFLGPVDSSSAITALAAKGIRPVGKRVAVDVGALLTRLNATGWFYGHDKIEGLASPDGGRTIYLVNDSDFGLKGLANTAPPFAFAAKILPNGRSDTSDFLRIDTSRLREGTQSRSIAVTVKGT